MRNRSKKKKKKKEMEKKTDAKYVESIIIEPISHNNAFHSS